MGFSLYNLFKACVLLLNALAVLHPSRFLQNCEGGGGRVTASARRSPSQLLPARCPPTCSFHPHADGLRKVEGTTGIKHQIAGLLLAVRFMRGEEGVEGRKESVPPSSPRAHSTPSAAASPPPPLLSTPLQAP